MPGVSHAQPNSTAPSTKTMIAAHFHCDDHLPSAMRPNARTCAASAKADDTRNPASRKLVLIQYASVAIVPTLSTGTTDGHASALVSRAGTPKCCAKLMMRWRKRQRSATETV